MNLKWWFTRREFVLKTLAAGAATGLPAAALGAEPGRKLGTCGPPPRKDPTRQTSAEAMPPLPLPAVPLRRSEPKAEPQAPLLIAKVDYGTTQDWNTDPGDVDNLMRHSRSALGLWYAHKVLPLAEVVANHKSGKGTKIPCLYFSGHDAFEFSADEREALARYVLDGGTLLADACCGRPAFGDSFVKEVARLFPKRAFDRLEVDHPIMRSFFNYEAVHMFDYTKGERIEVAGPAELFGMNIGTRAGVIYSPWDISCGWDNHTHEHGRRITPGDAIRLGINLVAYIAATRELAEVSAVTREFEAKNDRPRQRFTLAQLRHEGDWDPDRNSTQQWLRCLGSDSSLNVGFDLAAVDADEVQLAPHPFVYMTGFRDPKFTEREIRALYQHLKAGGMLFINNCSGYKAFDAHTRAWLTKLFPDEKLAPIAADHALFKSLYTVTGGRDRQTREPKPVELEGITLKGRLAVVYSKQDMITHLKQVSDPYGYGYDADTCRKLAVNLIAYSMQN